MFYKLIDGQNIVGVATQHDFRRLQPKHNLILICAEDEAQCVEYNGIYYRDDWLKSADGAFQVTLVDIVRIEEEEYNSLVEALEINQSIAVETPEEPEPAAEPTEEPDVTLEYLREAKIAQMSKICHDTIVAGFDVELSDGKTHHFSMEIEDQIKIQALALKAQSGDTVLPWHPDNELCVFYSANDILTIYAQLEKLQTWHTTYFNSLKKYIQSLRSVNTIGNVTYGMEIPERYQSEVLQYLMATEV